MPIPFSAVRAIIRKRDGGVHPPGEIEAMLSGFVNGSVTDYQMTSWMMAILFRGMNREETERLTRAMITSGVSLPEWKNGTPIVDKHSTGGVGDKVSLVVAPLAAACGLRVPMISGRSLGHTGGTLDKLESIPGYDVRPATASFCEIVDSIGASISGATEELVPADRRMYELRDVSGIIESPPLIVSSILSKKASARLDGLVLDVKTGSGGFMQRTTDARKLARMLVEASVDLGMRAEALLTWMGDPLGRAVGNSLEVIESIECLQGREVPADLLDLCLETVVSMLRVSGDQGSGSIRARVEDALNSGRGLERLARMIEAHGGDPRVTEDTSLMPRASIIKTVEAPKAGWITGIDARGVGEFVVDLGGGRYRAADTIDPRVGIVFTALVGDRVSRGQPLAEIHLSDEKPTQSLKERLLSCYRIMSSRPKRRPIILDRITDHPVNTG